MPLSTGPWSPPGYTAGYVPDHDATGKLIISFSRNPKDFSLPRYVQYRDVKKSTGLFLRIRANECARILDADLKDYVWADGSERPTAEYLEDFRYEQYRCSRFDYPMRMGDLAVDEADWDIMGVHQAFNAQKAMTARTRKTIGQLETYSNWDSDHVAYIDALALATYDWESSTTSDQSILKSIQYAVRKIQTDTRSVVKFTDLQLVASPVTWSKVATSQELRDYVKQQPSSPEIIEGSKWGMELWGMPSKLYGIPVVVEDAVYVSTARGATTQTASYIMSEGNVFLLARPGSIESSAGGGPSFSTITLFFKEEFTVETLKDTLNRRTRTDVVDHFDVAMTAPVSGFWFRGVTDDTSSA